MMKLLTKILVLGLTGTALQGPAAPRIKRDGDFRDLVTQSTVFADKSLLIKDLMEDESTSLLIAMPRRWGKTMNLNMLRRFLELPVDDHGKPSDREGTDNYKLFAGGKVDAGVRGQVELSPLKIADTKFFDRVEALSMQGNYPVIYIDLKDCTGNCYDDVLENIKNVLRECFERHVYLKRSSSLTEEEKELTEKYLGPISSKALSESEVRSGLVLPE